MNIWIICKKSYSSYGGFWWVVINIILINICQTWNNLKSTIVKCVTITDRLDKAGSKIAIKSAFVWMFSGSTRPDTLK